jgi:ABC-type dipeptide/oligopeptide/nickel transport system permease component
MARFLVRRILVAVPVLLGIVVLTFVLARVIPGDPCKAELGERATKAACDDFNRREGLNRPIPVQLGKYVSRLAHGDLGTSVHDRRKVTTILVERLPVTLQLSVAALFIAILFGVPLGVLAAYRHNTLTDAGAVVVANIGVSMPVFWLGLMLQYLFGVTLKGTSLALPPSGLLDPGIIAEPFYKSWGWSKNGVFQFIANMTVVNAALQGSGHLLGNAFKHLILPAVALGSIPLAIIARMTRSSLLDTLGLDYVRTARAKGLGEFMVVCKHALRNSLLPVTTVIGLSLGSLLGGAILTESIFNITGVGKTVFDSITGRDYAVVQGFTLVIAVVFVVINLLTDLFYTFLDPRVRVS